MEEVFVQSGAELCSLAPKEYQEYINKAKAVVLAALQEAQKLGKKGTGMILLIDNYDGFSITYIS